MRALIVVGLLRCTLAPAWAGDVPVKVYIDGRLQSYTPAACLRDGTVYVPLRQGAESLGVQCKWQPRTSTAQVCTDNGCAIIRKSEGIVVSGSLLLPLRRMGNAVGARVTWDAARQAVTIERP